MIHVRGPSLPAADRATVFQLRGPLQGSLSTWTASIILRRNINYSIYAFGYSAIRKISRGCRTTNLDQRSHSAHVAIPLSDFSCILVIRSRKVLCIPFQGCPTLLARSLSGGKSSEVFGANFQRRVDEPKWRFGVSSFIYY
jgi:hypothetical protein